MGRGFSNWIANEVSIVFFLSARLRTQSPCMLARCALGKLDQVEVQEAREDFIEYDADGMLGP